MPFPISFRRRYNTLALPCECVITIIFRDITAKNSVKFCKSISDCYETSADPLFRQLWTPYTRPNLWTDQEYPSTYNDWVVVLRPTLHKIGHFGEVPQANDVLAWYGKTKPNTQQKHTFTNQKKCTTTQSKHNE